MDKYFIQIIHGSADGMPTELYVVRNRTTGHAEGRILDHQSEAETWCETLNRLAAEQDELLNTIRRGQTP